MDGFGGGPKGTHKGWRVVGYRPQQVELARKEHEAEIARVTASNRDSMLQQQRVPAPWSEAVWMQRNKREPVRNEPYKIEAAAETCANLARRSGWTHVEIVEVKKGGA